MNGNCRVNGFIFSHIFKVLSAFSPEIVSIALLRCYSRLWKPPFVIHRNHRGVVKFTDLGAAEEVCSGSATSDNGPVPHPLLMGKKGEEKKHLCFTNVVCHNTNV